MASETTTAFQPRIGHVHLKVRDLAQSEAFYQQFLGMTVRERVGNLSFLSGGSLHHEIALQALGSNAPVPAPRSVGLYHTAFEVENREAFAEAYRRLQAAQIPVYPVDHRISWALYFDDPDGNGVEVYLDTRNQPGGVDLWHGENLPLTERDILGE